MKMKIGKLVVVINNPFKCLRQQAETILAGDRDSPLSKVSLETCPFQLSAVRHKTKVAELLRQT